MNSAFFNINVSSSAFSAISAERFVTFLAAFGASTMKPLEFRTTMPLDIVMRFLYRGKFVARACLSGRESCGLVSKPLAVCCKPKAGSGHKWRKVVTGNRKALDESKAYPEMFCVSLINLLIALQPAD